jgi:hypothetical protein
MTDALPIPRPTSAVDRGRRIALWLVGVLIALQVFALVASLIAVGSERLVITAVRLMVVLAVSLALLEGKNWARWVLLIPLLINVWLGSGLVLGFASSGQAGAALIFGALVLLYVALACVLVWSTDLRAFLSFKRAAHGV